MTYADVLRPATRRHALLYDLFLILGSSLLIGLGAQVAIPLPFSPVPVTGQTLAVLLTGAMLGSRRGSLAVLFYLAEGLAGLPVFAGGTAGIGHLLGPTGGYLLGFVAAAFVTGWLAERGWDRKWWTTLLAMLIGNGVLYAFGLSWLSTFVGGRAAFGLGMLPFIPGDLIKAVVAATLLPSGWRVIGGRE
ncbi:MAG TPA: biotin transporter BioY [Chloroflexi bacterium]|nr:biotin transporter BioY [Chloroflexota bacterium]